VSKYLGRTKSPEERELESKLAELARLESELIQKELFLTTLQAELQAFEFRYLRIVGIKIAKLDDINAQIAEVLAKLHANDRSAINEANLARKQAKESAEAAGTTQVHPELQEVFIPSENLKSLYRDAAKCIHPDLAADENDRTLRTALMAEVNSAYKAGDENKLRKMLEERENSPEKIIGDDLGAKLVRTIRKIAQVHSRLLRIQSEFDLLRESDLYKLRYRVEQAEREKRDLLYEMAAQLDVQVAEQQNHLDKLVENYRNSQTGKSRNG
jgi:hypothetical protein